VYDILKFHDPGIQYEPKLLLSVVLPRREFDADWVLEVIDYRRRRNHAAYLSHRKRRLEKLNQLE
jgi:hypothetical protein